LIIAVTFPRHRWFPPYGTQNAPVLPPVTGAFSYPAVAALAVLIDMIVLL
jgi:hypothetical protein